MEPKRKRHRRGKRGGRRQRERLQAKLAPVVVIPINPQTVLAMRHRLSLLTRKSA